MVLWIIEIAITAVGSYNIIKGVYNIYTDANKIKKTYDKTKKNLSYYKNIDLFKSIDMTESQYKTEEDEFVIL